MATARISPALRDEVRRRAGDHCEYCRTAEWLSGLKHEVDHIVPRALGGPTASANLCQACSSCNGYKLAKTHGNDPETGREVPLFHPRRDRWQDHFAWSEAGTRIVGLTVCGRATVEALHLNHFLIVAARAVWVKAGHHPPTLPEGPAEVGPSD